MLISILFENPVLFVLIALALILSLTIHEFSHAVVADKLGDPTARMLGRVSLNPIAHLDPLGTLLLLFAGFGWGKPVPFDSTYLKHPRRDAALIAFAGPFSNFILAILFGLIINIFRVYGGVLGTLFYLIVLYNLLLGFFNLIPLHPLDGFKVIYGLMPKGLVSQWLQIEPYGIFILLFLILTRSLNSFLQPLLNFALKLLNLR